MPEFYKIRFISGIGYAALIICSLFSFYGGMANWLISLVIIMPIPFIIELVISISYIILSIKNKKMHFLCFSILILFFTFILGAYVGYFKAENEEKVLIETGNKIEEYKLINGIEYLTEDDIVKIGLPKNICISVDGNEYFLRYNGKYITFCDGQYYSETKQVHYRSYY